METQTLNSIKNFIGKKVTLKGWIFNKRTSGKIAFLQFRDGYGHIQIVCELSTLGQKKFDEISSISIESSIEITGFAKEEKRSPTGVEISLIDFKILNQSEEYPIQNKEHGADFLMDIRHLWLRSKKQWAILRIRNTIINAVYEHLNFEGFIKFDSPILTPNACEGTTTLFEVPYTPAWKEGETKGINAYLSQSGQLYLEAAIFSFNKVFDFGPVFRAEKSKTRRHLTEFWMMDAEMAFCDYQDNMKIQEKLCISIVEKVLKENQYELSILERDIEKLKKATKPNYPVMEHKEAIKLLNKNGFKLDEMADLSVEEEEYLSNLNDQPIFITKYPKEIKAFYMKQDPDDNLRVLNNDMLAPEGYGEINGGSQREDDYEILKTRIIKEKLNLDDFQWYLDLRKFGSVVHSGFGIGLERYVRWICGIKHIRETIPFARTIYRLKP